jgi:copper/silver efflux system protein
VGFIALLGVDAETGVFMLLYLDIACYAMRDRGEMRSKEQLRQAIVEGAVKRLCLRFMTVAVMFMGLVPIMWSTGAGSDNIKRIAVPMIGGIFTSFLMELLVYPSIYEVWRWHFHVKKVAVPSNE